MKRLLKPIIAILEFISGWRIFEWIWDQRLFREGAENIGSAAAESLIAETPDLQILDVRSDREIAGGMLPGAVRIPFNSRGFSEVAAAKLEHTKPILVYCAGGYRSRHVVPILKEIGFREIYHLHRGFLAWKLGKGEIAEQQTRP